MAAALFVGTWGWKELLPTLAAQKQRAEGGAPGLEVNRRKSNGKSKYKSNLPTQAKEAWMGHPHCPFLC
jgi:hypothetical protein